MIPCRRPARGILTIATLLGLVCATGSGQVTANSLIVKVPTASWIFPANGKLGTDSPLSVATNVHTDPSGGMVFADRGNQVVLRLTSDGRVNVIAGNGIAGYSGDGGPATLASLNGPNDAVMDRRGYLYINDQGNRAIRRVAPDGTITTLQLRPIPPRTLGDIGSITDFPGSMAVDRNNNIYISHYFAITRITSEGLVSPFAGTGVYVPDPNTGCGPTGDGQRALETIMAPFGMVGDARGNLYIGEQCYIRKIDAHGIVSTIAGNGQLKNSPSGPARSIPLNQPIGVALDANENIVFAEQGNNMIRRIVNGRVLDIAGSGAPGYTGDGGPALEAALSAPNAVAVSGLGDIYIADLGNIRIRLVHDNVVTTVVGNGQFRTYPDGTPASRASLYGPADLAFDHAGNLLISEPPFSEIAGIAAADGGFHLLAGNGQDSCDTGSGYIGMPYQMAINSQGTLYFVDPDCGSIDQRTPDGTTTTIAQGVGCPFGIAVDHNDHVFFSDICNHDIQEIVPGGTLAIFAGINGKPGFSGDNGPASTAQLNRPAGLAFDPQGNLLVCDQGNHRVRRITPAGIISTLAGNGMAASMGDGGPASSAGVNAPYLVALDPAGVIFLLTSGQLTSSYLNAAQLTSGQTTLRRIDLAGTITTIAGGDGNPLINQGDGGPADAATLEADGLAIDAFGNVFLSSATDDSIRAILNYEPNLYFTHGSIPELPSSTVSFAVVSHGPPSAPYSLEVDSDFAGISFTADAGGLPWIKLAKTQATTPATLTFTVDPATLNVGFTTGTILLTRTGGPAPFARITVSVTVIPSLPPTLAVEPATMSLPVALSAASQPSQTLRIMNAGSDSLYFQIVRSGDVAGKVVLSATSGTVTAAAPESINVSINPAGLAQGTYTVNLVITSCSVQPCAPGNSRTVPLAISVTAQPQSMRLSQSGLTFTGVQGGGVTPPASFAVINSGAGSFQWTAQAIPLVSGPQWFSISPRTGTSTANAPSPSITVTVDPSLLPGPGVYYGIVRVCSNGSSSPACASSSPGAPSASSASNSTGASNPPAASNSPQDLEVVFNYLAPNNSPGAVVDRAGLIFVSQAGNLSPGSQLITITNLNPAPLATTPTAATLDGTSWLTVAPDAALQSIAAGGTLQLQVAARVDGLLPGIHYGTVLLQFGATNLEVAVRLIVTPGSGSPPSFTTQTSTRPKGSDVPSTTDCTLQTLVPVLTLLADNFTAHAGWPSALEALVADNCGNPLNSGQVVVSFSNNDAPVSLGWVGNGLWQGTWTGGNAGSQLTLTLTADETSPTLHGAQAYNGLLAVNTVAPAISSGPVQVAPGSILTIQGSNFAAIAQSALGFPLSAQLAGDGIIFAGVNLPMIYSSAGSVSALVPYNIDPDEYGLLVTRGGASTTPIPVVIGSAKPVILQILNGGPSDAAAGIIWNQITGGADPASLTTADPVQAGGNLTIYCTGLGALDAALDATQKAPSPAPNVASPVTVTIGTAPSFNASSSALVTGYAGMYVVQATVPPGIPAGDGVPLTVSVAGQPSAQVLVSVQPLN